MLGDVVAHSLKQHFLLRLAQVDAELLKGDDAGVMGIVVTADVNLVLSARLNGRYPPRPRLRHGFHFGCRLGGLFLADRG